MISGLEAGQGNHLILLERITTHPVASRYVTALPATCWATNKRNTQRQKDQKSTWNLSSVLKHSINNYGKAKHATLTKQLACRQIKSVTTK